MKKRDFKSQLNDFGFTLIEVLVAVIILAIVSIPVLHAFVSSAQTTAKSTTKMYATNAAENIMEELKTMTREQAVAKYGGPTATPDASGKYVINIAGSDGATFTSYDDEMNKALGKGYNVEITIDPANYVNSNSVNLSDFDSVSSSTAAIFSMTKPAADVSIGETVSPYKDVYEKKACLEFETRNGEQKTLEASTETKTAVNFIDLLRREIRVDIEKNGIFTDSEGNSHPKVSVYVTVSYLLPNNIPKIVADSKTTYEAVSKQVFNNSISEDPLEAIFLLYTPNYNVASDNGDIIIIRNHDSVEADLYIVAQDTSDAIKWSNYRTATNRGLILEIYENEVDGKQPLTLRTNLFDTSKLEYLKKASSEQVPIQCYLNVDVPTKDPVKDTDIFNKDSFELVTKNQYRGKFEDKVASKALNAQTLDGKTLDASTIKERIYDVSVKVWKPTTSDEWPISVTFKGTILE